MRNFIKSLIIITIAFVTNESGAQVGVGTTTPRGALDINSSTQGVVIPAVALVNVVTQTAVNPQGGAIPAGTIVYNTATSGVSPNNVAPGLYFWNGTRWVAFAGSPGGLDWSLKGNSGTNNGTDFLGTTDAQPLVVKVNSIERMRMGTTETVVNEDAQNYNFRIESTVEPQMFFVDAVNSHVHVRAASPFPTIDMFTAVGQTNDYAINGYASGQNCAAVYGRHSTVASGTNMNSAGAFDGAGSGFSTQPGWNVGIVATGTQAGVYGTATNPSSNNDARQGGYFSITNTAATTQSIASIAGREATGSGRYYGGFFDGNQSTNDWAFVGVRNGGTDYKIIGGGSVSTIVKDAENNNRVLFCPESPEITFTDSGTGKLVNGVAQINIDPILSKNIFVDETHPLKVFIQLEGDCNGVYVTNKSANGFKVKELQNGNSNVSFSWQLIATRADVKDEKGTVTSKHVDVRFPLGPDRIKFNEASTSKNAKK